MKKTFLFLLALAVLSGIAYTAQEHGLGLVNITRLVFKRTNYAAMTNLTEISPSSSYITLNSTGAHLLLAALPTISTATSVGGSTEVSDGTYVLIGSTMAALRSFVFQDNSAFAGTRLQLAQNQTRQVVTSTRTIAFIYSAPLDMWIQTSPSTGINGL